ncbi:MAG: mannonate dehydratase [Candidatus Latescibacterota bacterium]
MQRTGRSPGRGGTTYSTFKLSEYDNEARFEAGEVLREQVFERVAYFLERVVPVAAEHKVQLACHLNDPPSPVLNGVEKWNWPVFEGLKRYSELSENPYHGFNFCCGVAAEGLENPAQELPPIVKYFERAARSSTSIFATSAAACTTSARPGPTRATSTCTNSFACFTSRAAGDAGPRAVPPG